VIGSPVVDIGGVKVGDVHPVAFVAEVGTFFNRDIGLAMAYLEQAARAGAPIFKTEILHDPDVCLPGTGLVHEYKHAGGASQEDYRALIERKCVPLADYRKLFERCRTLGVPFIATVYDFTGVDFLADVGAGAVKIARDNVDNVPLIRYAARTGLPMIFDAGIVYLEEITRAVHLARDGGADGVVVNHHPGANPAPAEAHHLRAIAMYKAALGVPVGLACHYRGDEMLYVAIGAGANLLEKGVVEDPDRVEQDLVSASRLSELPALVRKVAECSASLGVSRPSPREPRDLSVRKGLVAKRAIAAGATITVDDLRFAWPPVGIPVAQWDLVVGAKAARALAAGDVVRWTDISIEG